MFAIFRQAAPVSPFPVAAASIVEGAVFARSRRRALSAQGRLTDRVVAPMVKATAEAAGLDPAKYAGHSCEIASNFDPTQN